MIHIKEVKSEKEKNLFFEFPNKLYKNNAYYVPYIVSEEKNEFNPEINGAFEYAEAKMFLAYKDNEVAGRIAGIYHKAYNQKHNCRQMRFSRFDVIDDLEVSKALIEKVADWAKQLNMNQLIGPIGFSDFDKQGLLIEGFEEKDLYLTLYNFPYYKEHLEKLGFEKVVDWVEYKIKVPEKIDPKLVELSERIKQRYGYEYYNIKSFKQIRPLMVTALEEIMNEVFADLFGVATVNKRQIEREIDMLKQIFNKDFVTAVMHRDEIIAYGFMAPSLSDALRKCNGKLFPFGFLNIIRALNKYDTVDFYSIGVRKAYQGKGANAMIMCRGIQSLIKHKVKYVETGPELETNCQVQSQWKNFEKRLHRRRRCYGKNI